MNIEFPEFEVTNFDDEEIAVNCPRSDAYARFQAPYADNPAFIAFLIGVSKIPGASVWHNSEGDYLLQDGEFNEKIKPEIEEMLKSFEEFKKPKA